MTLEELGIYSWVPILFLALGATLGWLINGLFERRKLVKLAAHTRDVDVSLMKANADLGAATAKVSELQASLDATKTNLDVANANLDSANAQVAAAQLELDEFKQLQAKGRGAAEQSYGALSAQAQGWKAELARQFEENDNLRLSLEGATKDLAKARADLETASQSLVNKDIALTEAYARAVKLEHVASDEQGQLQSLQAEVAGLKNRVAMLTVSNQDLDRRLQNARGEVANELAVLTSTMLRVKDEQLAQANATVAALQAQMAVGNPVAN